MKKILLLLIALSVVLVGCGGEETPDDDEKSADETIPKETTAPAEGIEESTAGTSLDLPAAQPSQPTVREYTFSEDYCPLTPELVRDYCGLEGSLTVINDEFGCTVKNQGYYVISFSALPLQEVYADYGVSNLESYVNAEIAEFRAQESDSCPVSTFPVEDIPDETIVASNYWVRTPESPCPEQSSINNLNGFQLYTRRGDRMGAYINAFSEDCSLEEVKNLVRVELLKEEIKPSEEITATRTAPAVSLIPASCPPPNLVAWWNGNGNTLDALKVLDALPIENSWFSSGKYGQAFSFSGKREGKYSAPTHILVVDPRENSKLDITDQLTVMAWIKVPTPYEVPSGTATLVRGRSYNIRMWTLEGTIIFEPYLPDSSERRLVQSPYGYKIPYNQWVHVAATTDKGNQNLKLYINGELIASQSYETPQLMDKESNLPFKIGWDFKGSMDEIMVFDRELSLGEILGVMELPNSCTLPEPALVTSCVTAPTGLAGWWPGDGNGEDVIGNNNAEVEPGIQYGEGLVAQAFSTPSQQGAAGGPKIKVPDSEVVDLNGDYSLMAWVKTTDLDGSLLSKLESTGDTIYSLGFYRGSPNLFRNYVSAPLDFQIPKNEWTHIAVTGHNNNQQVELYVNGIFAGAKSLMESKPFLNSDEPLHIGGLGAGYLGDSKIDEVMIFNRALSRDEIKKMVSTGNYGVCKS